MGQLLWTYGHGSDLQSDLAGFRLVAGRASSGAGYRYAVMARDAGEPDASPLASGSRESLREAIEAAERAVETIDPTLAMAS